MYDDETEDDFQQNPGEINPLYELKQLQKLAGDGSTPFSPPGDTQDRIGDTHQTTDTNIDAMEHYDESIEGASEIDLPGESADEDQNLPETIP